ncbi:hypothetical protein EV401DRAFT_2004340 [Pisolithus croceorrhizus]|nr:hypothetical protein EV401DRAFT_2004340 [Pisolithus croceorrhizus]
MINDRVSSNFLGSMNNLTNTSLRIATLQTIDYIRGSMKPEILSLRSNAMLTTAICGALGRAHALCNSLELDCKDFEREGEHNYIMRVVCEAI